ncbi:MAG: energy transducer TonB [Chlorobi bacterium]|nr:energy transducer TonB [Chlorobiota bacterium]
MKHTNQNQEFRFNEVLFEHRNKEYGAYVLRRESDRILTKAFFIGVSVLAAVSLTPLAINVLKTEPTVIPVDGPPVVIKLKKVDRPDTPPIKVEPIKPASSPKQYKSTVPEPKVDAVEPAKIEKPKDATPGLVDNLKGEPVKPDVFTPPVITIGTGTDPVVKPVVEVEKKDPNKIFNSGDLGKEANFDGGIDSFRNKVMSNFDGSGFDSGELMKTTITFIVEKDGTISGIKAAGSDADFNSEAVRTIRSIKGKWTPAKNKQGESVRSYFKFPITMKFDQ